MALVPDVIDSIQPSNIQLYVTYGNTTIHEGGTYAPSLCASKPRVDARGAAVDKLYSLIMADPDAPDPKNAIYREYVHWIVTNIPGSRVNDGKEVVPYVGPSPPIGTHRYAFLLYEQPNAEPFGQVEAPKERRQFNTRKFAQEYNLGAPVSATFYFSQK